MLSSPALHLKEDASQIKKPHNLLFDTFGAEHSGNGLAQRAGGL
jgi:hypothetical protein